MFCKKCGKEIQANAVHCPHCGNAVSGVHQTASGQKVGALGILFFLFPIVGWILYFVWKNDKPGKAKTACKLAWIGFGVGFVINMGILAAVAIPKFADLSDAAKAAACTQNEQIIQAAVSSYFGMQAIQNDGVGSYPSSTADLIDFLDDTNMVCPVDNSSSYSIDPITGIVTCDHCG